MAREEDVTINRPGWHGHPQGVY